MRLFRSFFQCLQRVFSLNLSRIVAESIRKSIQVFIIWIIIIITLAISKCYGKVLVLFFPRDNSLISRGNSHVSRVRGLVVRCLLFNPEVSCSNPWVCANFFYKYSEAESSHFRHYETFRLCETFFRYFLNVPKESSFQFLWYFATERMLRIPKGPPFSEFLALWDCSKFSFLFFWKFFKDSSFFFKNFQCLQRVHPSVCLIFCNRTNVKKSQRVPFSRFFGTMRLPLKFPFFVLFRNFFKDSKESPFNFSKFCNRMGNKKSRRVPSFTVFSIVRFYKRNNFRVKISRFSQAQHAISDFCFLNKKWPVFSMRLFLKICFTEAPSQFLPETKSFARVKDSSRFSPLCDLPETIKNIFEKIFSSFFCFFKGFSLRKMVFCCFQLGKNGSRDLCVSLRVFLAL